MRQVLFFLVIVMVMTNAPAQAEGVSADAAFERLSSLVGSWHGERVGLGEAAEEAAERPTVVHEIELSAAGTVVMETMNPDTDHEMINMYHRDGEDLVVTHYCAGGNQPEMRLDREASTPDTLIFDFAGGTNLDPAVDQHIHSARIEIADGDHIESAWTAHSGGEEAGRMTFRLARAD